MKTKRGRFEIVTCCGDHVSFVVVPVNKNGEPKDSSLIWEAAGVRPYQCGQCYDDAYRYKFVEFVKQDKVS